MTRTRQPWLRGPWLDGALILAPPLVAGLVVAVAGGAALEQAILADWQWFALVVMIDVAHVYGSVYRTFLDPKFRSERRALLYAVPVAGWIAGVMLYSLGALTFWRALAYLAVFHFVRQQYGFVRLYARRDDFGAWTGRLRLLDAVTIYAATVYPLLFWHLSPGRRFAWFVPGDFVVLDGAAALPILGALYAVVMLLYVGGQAVVLHRYRALNIPKNLVVLGTALAWYVGIVRFNGDWTFTVTNVVAHGVPYMALVWITKRKEAETGATDVRWLYGRAAVPLFVGLLVLLAYGEEWLWDGLVWREHLPLFLGAAHAPQIVSKELLLWLVPLLAVPQITHYVTDGFIWRVRRGRWTA
jgi:hypothetical protein